MNEKFNYVIGFRWNEADTESEIGSYSFCNNEVLFGTMQDAEGDLSLAQSGWCEYVYRIYKLTEVV